MSLPNAETLEREKDKLYLTDAELIRKLGVPDMADGLASRLDIARVGRLRMLGNGVVSLQAAYALRTLATRLAASGSAGAARLVRMMESGMAFLHEDKNGAER